jgi:preprotein translocase SecF subunit
MELVPAGFYFEFLGKRYLAIALSLVLVVGSFVVWFSKGQAKYGIDYIGGHELVVSVNRDTNPEELQTTLTGAGFPEVLAQVFDPFKPGAKEYSIRIPGAEIGPKEVREKVESALKAKYPEGVSVLKTDFVGPTVGSELKRKSLIALFLGLMVILLYVSFRFEFSFALGAVVALFHDVIIATGVYLLAGHQLNLASLAAALTIIGYSVNDTIVIFDKVREEIRKRKSYDLAQVLNDSINGLLSRTILTSLLTLFSAAALWIFGGGAIGDLSLYLVAGIVTGSYSTIFIAAPVVLAWESWRGSSAKAPVQSSAKRAATA